MAETSWIKLATDIPDHRKIKRIRKMPDGNNIILFWVFLLARAGESNHSGGLYMTDTLPYSIEDLAADFDFSTEFIEFGLLTLEKYGMIQRYDEIIFIKNWEEYQSVDGLDKIREQNRIRQANYREKQKKLAQGVTLHNVSSNDEVTQGNAIEEELDIDKEKDIDKKNKKPKKHKYGEYKNVLLSDEELEKLKKEFPTDWKERIERLSEYCASTGKVYKNYLATIRNWAKRDNKDKSKTNKPDYVYVPEEFRT